MLHAIALTLSLLLAQPTTAPATMPDKSQVQTAIERFMNHPQPGDDAQLILDFAQDSDDVSISLNEKLLTWIVPGTKYKDSNVLLVAFVAGDVKSQLDSGKNQDDGYAGLLSVFKVYDKLRADNKDLKIPEIEELQAKEKKGELKQFVQEASKNVGNK